MHFRVVLDYFSRAWYWVETYTHSEEGWSKWNDRREACLNPLLFCLKLCVDGMVSEECEREEQFMFCEHEKERALMKWLNDWFVSVVYSQRVCMKKICVPLKHLFTFETSVYLWNICLPLSRKLLTKLYWLEETDEVCFPCACNNSLLWNRAGLTSWVSQTLGNGNAPETAPVLST